MIIVRSSQLPIARYLLCICVYVYDIYMIIVRSPQLPIARYLLCPDLQLDCHVTVIFSSAVFLLEYIPCIRKYASFS